MNIDNEFNSIENLGWLPWVGINYLTTQEGQKLLLIGESHYYNPAENGSFEKHLDNGFTRIVIQKVAIEKEYKGDKSGPKIFQNTHFTFLENDKIKTDIFWNKVAYYNFIQTPMKKTKGRPIPPTKEQKEIGWTTFDKIINILKPDICIFLGNSAAKHFPQKFNSETKIISTPSDDGWVNNSASRKVELQLDNGKAVKIIFIKHPSSFYSWQMWNKHLKNKLPDLMAYLKN